MSNIQPFHIAFPVNNLEAAKNFYVNILECHEGRSSSSWIDFNLFGHQIVAHCVDSMPGLATNPVDGKQVPSMHFGVVLEWDDWHQMRDRLQAKGVEFVIGPYLRYEGQPGAQATMFIQDPSGNHLEFKSFKDDAMIFDTGWGPTSK